MANFFFGEGGRIGFNVDLITYVKRDPKGNPCTYISGSMILLNLKGRWPSTSLVY
jgi:hypothetical protein